MLLMELDDFEYHAEIASALNQADLNELAFSPMFVFLVSWAVECDTLGGELRECSVFNAGYKKLKSGAISFQKFVMDILDGKLIESTFDDASKQFVKDYIHYDGYVDDLTAVYDMNIGNLPNDFQKFDELCRAINRSRENYHQNKINFPELVVFSDPNQLLEEQGCSN